MRMTSRSLPHALAATLATLLCACIERVDTTPFEPPDGGDTIELFALIYGPECRKAGTERFITTYREHDPYDLTCYARPRDSLMLAAPDTDAARQVLAREKFTPCSEMLEQIYAQDICYVSD